LNTEVSHKIFTVPNLISLIRLLLVPVFYVLLVQNHNDILAFIVFLTAAATDWVDGHIARATNTVSRLGQLLDPFVDRVLIFVGVIAIFLIGRVPPWILFLLIARDCAMLGLTVYMRCRYGRDFKVIFLGKLTTALLMAGFCSLVLNWPLLPGFGLIDLDFLPGWGSVAAPLGIWLLYIGTCVSLITSAIYLYRGTREDEGTGNNKDKK
jgi:cardiolipin synthase